MRDIKKMLKELFLFNEPKKDDKFILKETEEEKNQIKKEEIEIKQEQQKKKRDRSVIKKLFDPNEEKYASSESKEQKTKQEDDHSQPKEYISKHLHENLDYMKKVFYVPENGDIVIREFAVTLKKDKVAEAFIILIDGMIDRTIINTNILQPLMLLSNIEIEQREDEVGEQVKKRLLPHNQLKVTTKFDEVIEEVNFGGVGLFVDGSEIAFVCDVKGWEHRGIERPNTEIIIRGPQEGFNEVLRCNTALVRKILKDEDLVAENASLGRRSKTPCSILYIKDIANDDLVKEVKRRIKSIKTDYVIDSGMLEQYLEDHTFLPAPQIIATERPDRVAAALTEGKVAVIMHGSPFALIMPATNYDLMHSAEDAFLRFPYTNFLRTIRIVAIFMSLLLPGLYVAITNYHHEMIPTDLLLAIEAAREKVPFPSVVEILIMEFSFELIREAGIRIPGPIGPTLGIIGALILGQAAVAANIVSPILIIIVAVTGIGSFAIPNYSLAIAFRILRFVYIFLGAISGFLGITTGLFIQGLWLTSAKSFGVPFLAPFAPRTKGGFADELTRAPIWKQETRPDYLNTKDLKKQPKISREWTQAEEKTKKQNEENKNADNSKE